MNAEDRQPFAESLQATMELYDKALSKQALQLWWQALSDYAFEEVRGGLSRHIQDPERGRFAPKPADVIAAIQSAYLSQWPSAEQAWAQAIAAVDERETVIWRSQEAQQAWHEAAQAIYLDGDEVGARVAFRESYNRLVRAAVEAGRAPQPAISLGHDPAARREALERATEQGLLSAEQARRHLPAPEAAPVAGLLTNGGEREYPAQRLRELREAVGGGRGRASGHRQEAIEAERQRQLAELEEQEGAA
ncbi:hypothetical protein [Halorhodospira sp. 9622]|uniref:hypothetical protein n=1 Tax=Halorhodospira sp. 9622 TaxID=2899136 RepID=UPI001EE95CDA|nr:hypothetical protein [Halorhodospira sp. 9622]MCG5538974.1 hypothetical protein [Halorhodospira sp. 9622]